MYKKVPPVSSESTSSVQQMKPKRDYFDDEDDINLPLSTNTDFAPKDEDVDPLDAFMMENESKLKQQMSSSQPHTLPEIVSGGFDDEDEHQRVIEAREDSDGEGDLLDYDSDGLLLSKGPTKEKIEPLQPVDHSTILYPKIKRPQYVTSSSLASLDEAQVSSYRHEIDISVSGTDIPRPLVQFSQAGFHRDLLLEIERRGYTTPTAIQAQAIPVVLSGRDLIGLAKTGSGKTFAFIWPLIMHVVAQPQMSSGDGPIGLVLCPTRELANQIYSEAGKFTKVYNIRACAVYGGAGKYEMSKALKESPEIVIATPGRLIEMVRTKATSLCNCSYVVLDEADRMFEMGFEYQMRSIVNNIRPDRQTLLFSATMKKKVEGFAREILRNPIRVVVGTIGQANPDIRQVVEVLPDVSSKWLWLSTNIDEFVADGKVLIFVSSKSDSEELAKELTNYFHIRKLHIEVSYIHGDKDQTERMNTIRRFSKSDGVTVLVATDVASRGLDIKEVRTVVNYTAPKNIESYVHRIGRTGRMGVEGATPGTSYTLLTSLDSSFAGNLIQNLKLSSQPITPELQKLAQADPHWRSSHNHSHKTGGKAVGIGFGGSTSAPKAMTSEQLAKGTSHVNPVTLIGTSLGSKFVEGQIKNKFAQPVQSRDISSNIRTSSAFLENSIVPSSDNASLPRRKSRFSAMENKPTSEPTKVLSGFVPASHTYSSVTEGNSSDNMQPTEKKRRWDN